MSIQDGHRLPGRMKKKKTQQRKVERERGGENGGRRKRKKKLSPSDQPSEHRLGILWQHVSVRPTAIASASLTDQSVAAL